MVLAARKELHRGQRSEILMTHNLMICSVAIHCTLVVRNVVIVGCAETLVYIRRGDWRYSLPKYYGFRKPVNKAYNSKSLGTSVTNQGVFWRRHAVLKRIKTSALYPWWPASARPWALLSLRDSC
jgi:hypothetical protein